MNTTKNKMTEDGRSAPSPKWKSSLIMPSCSFRNKVASYNTDVIIARAYNVYIYMYVRRTFVFFTMMAGTARRRTVGCFCRGSHQRLLQGTRHGRVQAEELCCFQPTHARGGSVCTDGGGLELQDMNYFGAINPPTHRARNEEGNDQ